MVTCLFTFESAVAHCVLVQLSSVLVHKSHKSRCLYVLRDSSVSSVFAYGMGSWGSVLSEVIFVITICIMIGGCKISFIF
jgi:hypothetical protein